LSRAERSLLVLDEAHLLDGDALTDLRLLISSVLDVRFAVEASSGRPGTAACRGPGGRSIPIC
jgi:hypothetical protein